MVDPTRFEALHEVLTPLIEAQIAGADRLVITRADEATPAELDETTKVVQLMAPGVPVHVVDATRDQILVALLGDPDPAGVEA